MSQSNMEWRRQELRRLWLGGARLKDIAAALSTSMSGISGQMYRMRKEGYDLPPHRDRMRRLLDDWPRDEN